VGAPVSDGGSAAPAGAGACGVALGVGGVEEGTVAGWHALAAITAVMPRVGRFMAMR